MIVLIFFINLAISWVNAWGCGATWDSTKAKGGIVHFMNWMGVVMAACGFTWCYMAVFGYVGTLIPITNEETGLSEPLLNPVMLQAFYDIGFLVIVPPILGSGIAITVASIRQFARSRNLGDGAVAGWNTFAQVHNVHTVVKEAPSAFDRVSDFFADSDGYGRIVVLLVVLAVAGGILTTYGIVQMKRRSVRVHEALYAAA